MSIGFLSRAIVVCAGAILAAGCISDGGDGAELATAMPTDTYETCSGGSVGGVLNEGVNFLSSGSGSGRVKLGMSECALIRFGTGAGGNAG